NSVDMQLLLYLIINIEHSMVSQSSLRQWCVFWCANIRDDRHYLCYLSGYPTGYFVSHMHTNQHSYKFNETKPKNTYEIIKD
ncbi:MAG: hypothetical protein ACJ701_09855, partial [Nitrososphaera sp.]